MLSPPQIKKILTNWYVLFLLESNFYIVFEAICAANLLISIGSLFHKDGPPYDALFKPLFNFLRVALTFKKMTVYLCYWV